MFSKTSAIGGITKGEQGVLISMTTRWLSHFQRMRQALALAPVRTNFGTTSHEPLAQFPGKFTFHVEQNHTMWETLGEEETKLWVVGTKNTCFQEGAPDQVEGSLWDEGVIVQEQFKHNIIPMMSYGRHTSENPMNLKGGNYELSIYYSVRNETSLQLCIGGKSPMEIKHSEHSPDQWLKYCEQAICVIDDGVLHLNITNHTGELAINAIVLQPQNV
jgi:hypothetical protein